LQALVSRNLYGSAYLNPRLIVSQSGTAQQLAWEFAKEILRSPHAPRRGHGQLTAVARLVQPRLKAAGYVLKIDTVADYLRPGLKDWHKEHPGC
jgi:hypothetical protein